MRLSHHRTSVKIPLRKGLGSWQVTKHSRGHGFHNDKETEMASRGWFRMQKHDLCYYYYYYYYSFRINMCVSILALVIRHANRIFSASYSIIICVWPVLLYSIYPHYLINGNISGGENYWILNACFGFLYNVCLQHFLNWEELREISSHIYIGLHKKYSFFLPNFDQT